MATVDWRTVSILLVTVGLIGNVCSLECISCRSDEYSECSTLKFTIPGNLTELPSVTCRDAEVQCESRVSSDGITIRGCKAVQTDCTGSACSTCSTDKCNGGVFPIDRRSCLQCSGPECEVPQNAFACPKYQAVDSCYTVFSKDGKTTYRGCVSDSEQTVGGRYCDAVRELCIKCSVNGCNTPTAIIQDNPLSCVKCDSISDPNCAHLNEQHLATGCGSISNGHVDACYVHVLDGVLRRGCLSEMHEFEYACQESADVCELCTTANCNSRTVERETCHECNAEIDPGCQSGPKSNASYGVVQCPLGLHRLGCYHYEDGGIELKRGCVISLSSYEIDFCQNLGQQCKVCPEDNCNSLVQFQACHQCSTNDSLQCYNNASSTDVLTCRNYEDQCLTGISNNAVERKCAPKNTVDTDECEFPAQCEFCAGTSNCNALSATADDFCYTCDTKDDPNCRDNLDDSMKTQCTFSVRSMGCYREEYGDGHIRRGCVNNIPAVEVAECLKEGSQCKTCSGPYCNGKIDFQWCRTCNSSESTSCFRSPGSFPSVMCPGYEDTCYVHLENNEVVRGCTSDAEAHIQTNCNETGSDFCETCEDRSNCNNKLIDGEFCYTCNSEADPGCGANATFAMRTQCPLAVKPRGCFLFNDGGDDIKRGCVADLIPDEINMCRAQQANCKTCIGNDCNSKLTFQRCRSCNSTQNINCIRAGYSFASVSCPNYYDDCYTHVDSQNVVTRGCLSDSPSAIQSDCRDSADGCETCTDANGCNDKVVDGEFCLTCNSEDDPNCRTNANYTIRTQCPLSPSPMGCYLFNDGGELVKRGCVADLIPYELEMCRREGEFCKTCIGNDCNAKPTFQTCRACNSSNSVNCIRSPGSFQSVVCQKYTDECFVHVDNNIVTRGCLSQSNTKEEVQDVCANGGNEMCRTCDSTSNCNNRIVDGEFCLTCDAVSDEGCRSNANFTMRTQCPLSVDPVGCYLFNDGGDSVKRGCVADILPEERDMCRRQGDTCKTCIGNDCNTKATFQRCRSCSSAQNVNCIRSPNSFAAVVCQNYDDECFSHVQDNIVTRGCLNETILPAVTDSCKNGSSEMCQTCSDSNSCNNRIVDGEFCLTCNSENDPDCRTNANYTVRTQCPLSPSPMGCYLFNDGGDVVKRGCVADLIPDEIEMCRREGQLCKTCIGNDCNAKPTFQTCRACNSSTSVNCIRSPGSFQSVVCPKYTDQCYVHVENNTVTRGCLSQSSTQEEVHEACSNGGNEMCRTCDATNNCNNRVVDGEFCLTCDADLDEGCRENANFTMRTQCPLSVDPMGCYLFNDGGSTVKRGCVADIIPDERNMCRRQGDFCKTCIGNDCNSKATFQRCRSCSSSQNVNCIRSPNSFASVVCQNYDDECFVHVEDNIVTRGCLNETRVPAVTVSCNNSSSEMCQTCSDSNSCNNRIVDGEFCLTCTSENDPDCRSNANYTVRTQCPLSPSPMGCYLYNDGGDLVKRGCVADLIPDEIEMCRREGEFCKTCIGNDCNAKPTFQTCRACNSTASVNCIRSPGSFQSVLCPKYTDQCYVHVENNTVTRGCLSQSSTQEEVHEACSNGGNEMCRTCDATSNCNNRVVDGEFCLTCDADLDEGCRENANFTMRTQCPLSVDPIGCYLFNDGGNVVKRGCVADIIPEERDMCHRQGDFCKTCIGNDCNVKATFQRCRACSSNQSVNCIRSPNSFASVVCQTYDDECFVHVDNNIVTRGCLNETTVPAVIASCNGSSETCQTCSDSNSCNNRIVDGEFCLTCNSENDPNCLANTNYTMRVQCPLSPNPRGCYRFEEDGVVKRGCVAELKLDEEELCLRQGSTCKTCIGNDCNEKVSFQTCRACNSTNNVNCIRSPNAFAAVMCEDYLDECYVNVENDIVTRGCLASAGSSVHEECKSGDGELCETCSNGPICNNKIVDGEFCLACRSDLDPNCRESLNITMREQCPLSVNPRGCYTFDDSDKQVRGCVAKLVPDERNMCREEGLYCKTCRGNDCNAKVKFTSCRTCSSGDSVACIRSPNSFQSVVCRDYMDECVSHAFDNVITRGCLAEIQSPQVKQDCVGSANNDLCSKCSDAENCNNQIVDGEFCLECDSTEDPNCLSNANFTMRIQCPLAVRPRGCYRFDDVDSVKRGCVASILPEEIAMCRRQGDTCKTCIGNDCNQKAQFQQCRTCSSANSVNCIRSPNSFAAVTCRDYTDKCYTHVVNNVVTRGCLAAARDASVIERCSASDSEFCHTCQGNSCNNRIVDGEFCLTCDSSTDSNCRTNANYTMRTQCQLSTQPKGCYLYDDGGDDVKRGCLSDISADEVAMCRRQGSECKTCIGDDCNIKPRFQSCRVCNSTANVSCIRSPGSFASQVCRNYLDECFVHVDNDVVTRGCLANTSPEVVRTCNTNPELCAKCSSGPNCNNRIIDGEFCLDCDSTVNPNCREKPDFTIRKQCPLAVQPRGCYLFNDIDTVKRGCVSDIIPDEIGMCRQQTDWCKTCIGNDCNQKVSFQQCKVCNSAMDVDCIRYAANYIDAYTCWKYTDDCFVHVRNNTVTRGCLSADPNFIEDCADPNVCETCQDRRGCNDKIVDGEFCITCTSDTDPNCRSSVNHTMHTQCNLAVTPLGCYHHEDSNNSGVERGCISDLDDIHQSSCRNSTSDNCKLCLGNDCNVLPALRKCIACDSLVDDSCVSPNAGTVLKTCDAYADQCFTHIEGERVRRGCLLEVAEVLPQCTNNGTQCEVCSNGTACNRRSVEQEFCFECNSNDNPNCADSVNGATPKSCTGQEYGFDRRGCYHWANADGTVRRGCVNDLPESSQKTCESQEECKTCLDNRCNEKASFQSCHQCDTASNPLCVDLVSNPSAGPIHECRVYTDTCKTMISPTGYTLRGCTSDLPVNQTAIFEECLDNNCNGGIYPRDRIKCHQCSGTGCDHELASTSSTLKVCSNYIHNDICYGFIDENNNMNRGCYSDRDAVKSKCIEFGSNCYTCSISDGCNNKAKNRASSLSCIQCASTEECKWGYQATNATICQLPVKYGRSESCYTYATGLTVSRGCRHELVADNCPNGVSCQYCTDNGCNQKSVEVQTCQDCNSDIQDTCRGSNVIGFTKSCIPSTGILEYHDRGCFSKNHTRVITRGCLNELPAEERNQCTDEAHTACEVCYDNNCNTKNPPNSSSTLKALTVLVICCLAILANL